MLLRLQTTARLMQTTAHPDDEDGGMLTLESRGKGDTALLMTLTRGEGGQNKVGSNLFDVLGVLRTLELTASDRYYGVEQRFSRVADFGYSKNPEETFQKWGGHDIPLSDMVRVIRTFRPDVLIARFSGTERDGHGHHQASAILTKEAFRAAADPKRFPEQIKEGLQPWQAKKLYVGNVCGFGASTCAAENYTVRLNTGHVNPLLGMSYIQFAMEGLRHQLSQGAGGWTVEPGDRYTYYKLVDSVLPPATDKDGHEKDFFDGIDTSLGTLISPSDAPARKELAGVEANIAEAAKAAEKDPGSAAAPLFSVVESLARLEGRLRGGNNQDRLARLIEKESQARTALNLALNLSLQASLVSPPGSNGATGAGRGPAGRDFPRTKVHRQGKAPQRLGAAAASPLLISRRSGNGQRSQGAHFSGAAGAGLSDGFPGGAAGQHSAHAAGFAPQRPRAGRRLYRGRASISDAAISTAAVSRECSLRCARARLSNSQSRRHAPRGPARNFGSRAGNVCRRERR